MEKSKFKCEECGRVVEIIGNGGCAYCKHNKKNGCADKMTEVKNG